MKLSNRLRSIFWRHYLRFRGARVGKSLTVCGPMDILLRDGAGYSNLVIGNDVVFGGRTYIRIRRNGRVVLGDGARIGVDNWLVSANDFDLQIGKGAATGQYCVINAGHGVSVGEKSVLAAFVYVNSTEYGFSKGEFIVNQGYTGSRIEIGSDVWVGGHVFINKGVKIGNGSIVGAGSVVLRDVPEYKIVAGNPARVIRDRD